MVSGGGGDEREIIKDQRKRKMISVTDQKEETKKVKNSRDGQLK